MTHALARPTATRRFDVCICGDGVVAQTLALLLARERLRVALVGAPQAAAASADVRAYALNAASRALLQELRVWPDAAAPEQAAAVTPVQTMQVWGDRGGALDFSAAAFALPALSWIVDVPTLEQRLSQALSFQSGIERCHSAPAAALTVICEGKRSPTRASSGLEYEVFAYPHKALAARLACERPHAAVARQWFADGHIMALLPLDGAVGNSVALVWSLPLPQADAWAQAEPQALAQAVAQRCGHALGAMQLQSPVQCWPLELARAPRWIARTPAGGVALAGDAAHAMHPLAGQGLNVGLADVAALARVLREREYWRELGDYKLLRRYERARAAAVAAMSWATDGLFELFAHPDARVQALRNWGLSGFSCSHTLKGWAARQASGLNPLL
ncbi:FAD-dependent monooxygenase [Hydrogenophaga sp.]|uniref:FAD-dependent monooxygenase n=1 Tax=Hydrogenophaga sp. TaxID=1904254 RepID=UPI0019A832C6|nr:FAD-dependent monooxygenase [Hydrogenophaga sp.]MBD3893535.1 ubiquinone biosynthesis protein UbiH [Hydrogenophaga sp.]